MWYRALILFLFFATPSLTVAASLSLSPSAGTFAVGSTFDVSIFLNSGNQSVNAVGAILQFPPDKLQLVSPSVGRSIVGVWVTAPQFNNQTGQINLEGVIPGGIKADKGLLTTLTFRVKSVGQAVVKFSSQSKVLLNDGIGTDALEQLQNGIYQLVLPPPAGPLVTSETHPDQTEWYANDNIILTWAAEEKEVQGFSYVLNDEPIDVPDDISEGARLGVSYKQASEGRHFFHIKALRAGVWGETTHFAVLVDKTPPAEFPLEILPDARTTSHQPVIQFATTDSASGLDHYELKVVSLQPTTREVRGSQALFIETTSPYVPGTLGLGDYDVIVRAYDQAGNYREMTKRLAIVLPLFRFVSNRGLVIGNNLVINWLWLWFALAIVLVGLTILTIRLRGLHFHLSRQKPKVDLPEHVRDQLTELEKYRSRYGKALVILLIIGVGWGLAGSVSAETLVPPVVTTAAKTISNRDIFYLGGRANPLAEIVIYLQNPTTGELTDQRVLADDEGNWFYRHGTFLAAGDYLVWTQAKRGNELSPPGPQLPLVVESQAFQLGASRLSYQSVYLVIIVLLVLGLLVLLVDIVIHWKRIKQQRQRLMHEVREAEESVRRGFAVLRRDIEVELKSAREQAHRERLLADLEKVEKYIGKEVWDLERSEV